MIHVLDGDAGSQRQSFRPHDLLADADTFASKISALPRAWRSSTTHLRQVFDSEVDKAWFVVLERFPGRWLLASRQRDKLAQVRDAMTAQATPSTTATRMARPLPWLWGLHYLTGTVPTATNTIRRPGYVIRGSFSSATKPGAAELNASSPSCSSAVARTMARPTPLPGKLRLLSSR